MNSAIFSMTQGKFLALLGVVSVVCSRTVFFFIDDPEGPNLLVVGVLAALIFSFVVATFVWLGWLHMVMENIIKRLSIWAAIVAGVLMIPLATNMPWTEHDFVFAGGVLFGAAVLYEIGVSKMENRVGRIVVGASVAFLVLVIWAWAVA